MPRAVDEAFTARLARAFQRRRIAEQEVRRREAVGQEAKHEVRPLAIDLVQTDRIDPFVNAALERDPVLRDAFEDGLLAKRGIAETRILRVRCRFRCAEQNANRFLPQTRRVLKADRGLQQALTQHLGAGPHNVVEAETDDGVQRQRAVRRGWNVAAQRDSSGCETVFLVGTWNLRRRSDPVRL